MLGNEVLALVPADISLAEQAADYYRRNRVFLKPFDPVREEAFFTADLQRSTLEQEIAAWEGKRAYRFYIKLLEAPDQIIGMVGLSNVIWGAFESCHLGYKLDQAHVGRGYMTAAVALVTEYAFQEVGLHRIEGNVMPRNRASLRVLEKNSYVNEGLSRSYLNINGVWEDHVHMVKLNQGM